MRFLLVNASTRLFDPNDPSSTRPAEGNGDVIGEVGEGSVLSLTYPCDDPPPGPDCEPDLPPFDIQFDPEGFKVWCSRSTTR